MVGTDVGEEIGWFSTICPILLPVYSLNQILPSGPAVMPIGLLLPPGRVYSVMTPAVVILPILLPPVVKDDGVVLVMQNGLGIEEEVAKIVGPTRVMGGLCFLCSNKTGPGHICHLDYGMVSLGEFAMHGVSDRMRQVADDFQRAGIPIQLAEDLAVARWQKLVWNIPYNGLSVVLDANTDALMANVHTRRLVEKIMRETVADARAVGVPLEDAVVERMLGYTAKMKPYRTSMKIDLDERRPMEVEAIFGNPLRAAQKSGIDSPLLETLYRQLKFLDERNRATAASV